MRSIGLAGLSMYVDFGIQKSTTYLLSQKGCGRATGYAEANKIITAGNKTFFSWLESENGQFGVYIRAFDHENQELTDVVKVGDAHDNHGGPALTIDNQGILHILYFPHHHPMRYRRTERPFDISEWQEEVQFGEHCTYPTLICGAEDNLYCSVRISSEQQPWEVHLYRKSRGSHWQLYQKLLRSRHTGYAHFQESMSWSHVDHKLHLLCRFHEGSDGTSYGRLQTVAYMQSSDFGQSWQKYDGTPISLPAEAEALDVLANGGEDYGILLRAGGLSVDRNGVPHLIYSEQEGVEGRSYLVKPNKDGNWRYVRLNQFLPKWFQSWMLTMPGGVSFDGRNNMFIVAQIKKINEGEKYWGHPSNEVVSFYSDDGGETFQFNLLSDPDAQQAHWLPNIERNTGYNLIEDHPMCIYTSGPPGANNKDILANSVVALKL